MLRTTRTPSSDLGFRGSNGSLARLPALPSASSSLKSASYGCSVATIVWTRWPSRRTACLRATAFIASRRWRPLPGCHHDSSRGVSSRRSVCRPSSTLESSDSTPPWITSSDIPAVPGAASPTIRTTTIRCTWCTTVALLRVSPLHGSWRNSKTYPHSTRSSRLETARETPVVTVCQTSHPYYLATLAFTILDVTPTSPCGGVRASRGHHVRQPSRTSPEIHAQLRPSVHIGDLWRIVH